jgi:arsenate reductase (glutaredoxin)
LITTPAQQLNKAFAMSVTIYHNPACGTSRNTLALLREKGVEPKVIEYLKTPPTREDLVKLVKKMKVPVRDILRQRGEIVPAGRIRARDFVTP